MMFEAEQEGNEYEYGEGEEEGFIPQRPTIATLIIPPQQQVTIQGVPISNLTTQEIEIHLKLNNHIKEIAIDKP